MNKYSGVANGVAGIDQNQQVSLREKKSDRKNKKAQGCVATQSPDKKPRSHRRSWSIDLSKRRTSEGIVVTKNKKEPQPPERGVSLLQPDAATSKKRYSCPPMGTSPCHSSSSSTSSCSSPPPVKTSVITGHDPLGWKLRPKSGAASSKSRSNRLSLQIAIPTVPSPDPTKHKVSPTIKPALGPKPHRRRHSDTSALIRSLEAPMFAVTLEDLRATQLHPVALSEESDDVFVETSEDGRRATDRPRKVPPTVPEKTAMARQIAQLIACSRQRWRPARDNVREDEPTCGGVMKTQPKTHRAGQ
ncbi:unnamed protein product [Ophioblennius macclurei]